ncbi:MAG: peptidoglycan DD-metalloendopeptidase family protein [Betaproteobacteria bacterium]
MKAIKPPILAHGMRAAVRRIAPAPTPGQWVAMALCGLSGVAAFGLAPDTTLDIVPTQVVRVELPLPAAAIVEDQTAAYWHHDRIRRGDTIGSVLSRLGVDDAVAMEFLRTNPSARALYQLRPGKALNVETDAGGRLLTLHLVTSDGARLAVTREGERLVATMTMAPTEVRWKMAAGEIRTSLFGAADAAGVPDPVTLQMADVFGGDIDFLLDLRRGDRFTVVYEMRYVDGEAVGPGRIVAAEFQNRGRTLRAFLWRGDDGGEHYYGEDGAPLRKAFLRSPMELSRVTSGFSGARFHPILQAWRAHKGVDYAAPAGTPVRATGDARVVFAGTKGGYGNVIELRHHGVFSTLYAHLSRFAPQVKAGAHVAQGDVIGYVGQTGWATGPHLHYEFRVAGDQRNPLTVALPAGEPLAETQRVAFAERIVPAAAHLALARDLAGTLVAAGE